jgi:4-hydroxy-3-methylbut-2-enyl diphosphate reductase IspH
MVWRKVAVVLVTGAALVVACRRDHDEVVGTTTITSAKLDAMTTNDAIERLVEARCNHEQLCHETGMVAATQPGGCADDVRSAIGDMLVTECPQGVSPSRLFVCTTELREAPCGGPLVATMVPETCRSAELCVLGATAR